MSRLAQMMGSEDAKTTLLGATGRESLGEAIDWVAADHPILDGTTPHKLLEALIELEADRPAALDAIRRLTRSLVRSELDTAAMLFATDEVAKPDQFRSVLDLVAHKSPDGSLVELNASAVIAAQGENSFTMEALCTVAGLAYSDLGARVDEELPADPAGHWSVAQIRAAFRVIDSVVRGKVTISVPGAKPSLPLELVPEIVGTGARQGWQAVESMRRSGVSYEILLAQRLAGGAWLAHRNRTSSKVTHALADQLCQLLDTKGIAYKQSTSVGGSVRPSVIHAITEAGKQVGIVPVDRSGSPACGVIFSVARDSGTASKNASRLMAMSTSSELPLFIVVAGAGWAARNETADLAIAFNGRIYPEGDIKDAAGAIEQLMTTRKRKRGDS